MGHYASEMMCDACGNLRCTCPPPPKKPNTSFIVTSDHRVMTVDEFDAAPENNRLKTKYGSMPLNPVMLRMGLQQFKFRPDAETHARERCEAAVEDARAHLARLKKILKVERPWESK